VDPLKAAVVRDVGYTTAATRPARRFELSVHVRTVQEILGRSRITITERYTHVASPMQADAAKRMGETQWESS
jgi:integrase